jgi:beta-mannosidase
MKTIDLSGEWRLVRAATKEAVPALVPGDTHSALLAALKIPDPYVGMNELDVQWVGREDWSYERDFNVEKGFLAEEKILLSCDSLDTIADIFLNGKKIGHADNMFLRWRFDAKPFLRPGKNSIRIFFASAEKAAAAEAKKLPYPVPHNQHLVQSPHRNLVRKVQCHSGWDWGLCLMVAGIRGDISLGAFSDTRIDYILTEQRHSKGRCVVRVSVECEAARDGDYELAVTLGGVSIARTVKLVRGENRPRLDIAVDDPKLWWPNDYGEQPLYELTVRLGGHSLKRKLGLRKLQLVNRRDTAGLSMAVRVNGVDVFCKGANWIPSDALPQRESRDRLDFLLSSAARAHMNMLRVWGGGQYESDAFYELCDEKGILVWQDMMFSCALYPATPAFLANVEREVRHQVKRLRDHPCIALWCGNNEDVGALTWFRESRQDRDRYLVDYDRLNEGVIGRIVDECDPTRTFWPSSPSAGRGDYSDNWHDDGRGDMHYWTVWHEGKPFSAYYAVHPRFCSEFGYQSFPSIDTIRSFAGEEDLNVTSPIMEHHQRHPGGNSIITEMFTRYFRVPEGFESFVYLSQVQQALAIKTAVEYWRRLRPLCMGTLYWQLNDNWPVVSWSSVEYGGAWKLLHYAARRFFAPVLLAAQLKDGQVEVWLTNDLREPVRGRAVIAVVDFEGRTLMKEEHAVQAPAGSAGLVKKYTLAGLTQAPDAAFLLLTLERGGETVTNELFLTEPKRCAIPPAEVHVDVTEGENAFTLRLSVEKPAFYVSLTAGGIPGEFDDNGFTLLPGAPRVVAFQPRTHVTCEKFQRALSVRHLRDTYR